jgi:hypothetical protein
VAGTPSSTLSNLVLYAFLFYIFLQHRAIDLVVQVEQCNFFDNILVLSGLWEINSQLTLVASKSICNRENIDLA